jgi:hypothetical protein
VAVEFGLDFQTVQRGRVDFALEFEWPSHRRLSMIGACRALCVY